MKMATIESTADGPADPEMTSVVEVLEMSTELS